MSHKCCFCTSQQIIWTIYAAFPHHSGSLSTYMLLLHIITHLEGHICCSCTSERIMNKNHQHFSYFKLCMCWENCSGTAGILTIMFHIFQKLSSMSVNWINVLNQDSHLISIEILLKKNGYRTYNICLIIIIKRWLVIIFELLLWKHRLYQ